jgi:hypothetical protein
MLGNAKLSPEQRAFVDVLAELDAKQSQPGDEENAESSLEAMKQELADLREANDTVAAALGACPYCWGGDRNCEVCRGRGRSGYRRPDPALFNELVVPAIQRVRALKRVGSEPRSSRTRV